MTGVWAEENTREALFTRYAEKKSSRRLRLASRFVFAGYDHEESDGLADRYAKGVPMGAELHGADGRARTCSQCSERSSSAALQRLQIVKGWVANGQTYEEVYDVALLLTGPK